MPKPKQRPDNSHALDDGGFYFRAWGIHVKADSLEEAKAHIREYHGHDVDKETPPPKPADQV